jgi:NAD(P)-dependent dehydrogenase (short-subunit alcohol dehydrogenase family)
VRAATAVLAIPRQRTFTLGDQRAFARLSGDFNPLHVDPLAARRFLFGAPVVHGVHAVLWALDQWLGDQPGPGALRSLRAVFRRPVAVGESVRYTVTEEDGDGVEVELAAGGSVAVLLRFRWEAGAGDGWPAPPAEFPPAGEARVRSAGEMADRSGTLPLACDASAAARLLPRVAAYVPPLQIASVLAATRLVGMECPGLHSVFSELGLEFQAPGDGPLALEWRVRRYFPHVRLAHIDGAAPGVRATVRAFLRPEPVEQPSYGVLRAAVAPGEFAGQRALVVGGSRGLGEVAAKLLAGGGAAVRVTWHRGAEDAERVAAEIRAGGGRADASAFDATDPAARPPAEWAPTHLYYFATPRIAAAGATFSADVYQGYRGFYVEGFVRCAEALLPGLRAALYPSSVFVDDTPDGMLEYAAAKAAGESACRAVERQHGVVVLAPRLPRLATDQAAAFVGERAGDPVPVLLPHLRRLRDAAPGPSAADPAAPAS